jgi:hypothetical protein
MKINSAKALTCRNINRLITRTLNQIKSLNQNQPLLRIREREERFSSALILIRSTTPKTCAIIATTGKAKPRWLTPVDIHTSLITPVGCARIATWPNTTSRESQRLLKNRRLS